MESFFEGNNIPIALDESCFDETTGLLRNSTRGGVHVTTNDISKGVTIVMFFAPWCGHCQVTKPQYALLADRARHCATVAAVDGSAPENRALLAKLMQSKEIFKYSVQGFPTFVLYNNGQYIGMKVGSQRFDDLLNWVISVNGQCKI